MHVQRFPGKSDGHSCGLLKARGRPVQTQVELSGLAQGRGSVSGAADVERSSGYTEHRVQVHGGATAESHIHTSCRSLGVRGPLCAVTDGSIPLLRARVAKDREMHKCSSYYRESNRSQVNRSETHRVLRSHNHLFQRSKRSVEKLLTQKRGRGSERHLPPPPSEALGEGATLRTQ